MVLKSYEKTLRRPADHTKHMTLHKVTKWTLSRSSWAEWAQQLARLLLEGSRPVCLSLNSPLQATKLDMIHSSVPSIESRKNAEADKLAAYLVWVGEKQTL